MSQQQIQNQNIIMLTGSYDQTIKQWKVMEQKCATTQTCESVVTHISLSPNKLLMSVCMPNLLKIVRLSDNMTQHTQIPKKTESAFSQAGFTPNGDFLFAVEEDGYLIGIEMKVSKEMFTYNNKILLNCLKVMQESLIIGDQSGKLKLFNFVKQSPLCVLQVFDFDIGVRCCDSYEDFIVAADSRGIIAQISLKGNEIKLLRSVQGHTDMISCVKFAPNGQLLATCGSDKIVKIWDIVYTPDKSDFKIIKNKQFNVEGCVFGLDWSQNAQFLLVGCDKTPRLFKVEPLEAIKSFTGHQKFVTAVVFSDD